VILSGKVWAFGGWDGEPITIEIKDDTSTVVASLSW